MNNKYEKFLNLKSDSGLHSPSIFEVKNILKLHIKVDACFLCNPYAFDLFMNYYKQKDLSDYMKYYPPQNKTLASLLSKSIGIDPDYLMLGNGAIQLIELILREYEGKRKCIITPTFSTYYEFDYENICFFQTHKENNFTVDKDKLIKHCLDNNVEVLVIVNPNNPTGNIFKKEDLDYIMKKLNNVTTIVDESFIDFFDRCHSLEEEVYSNDNLIVIRSLSKDFGIAGLRLGYSVISPKLRNRIFSKYGLCWNINGFAHFFLELLDDEVFSEEYKVAREKYLNGREVFYKNLLRLNNMKVYESNANFFILDCKSNINKVFFELLFEEGIYTRILNDKLHLDDTFLRISCGTNEDNQIVFEALKKIDKNL